MGNHGVFGRIDFHFQKRSVFSLFIRKRRIHVIALKIRPGCLFQFKIRVCRAVCQTRWFHQSMINEFLQIVSDNSIQVPFKQQQGLPFRATAFSTQPKSELWAEKKDWVHIMVTILENTENRPSYTHRPWETSPASWTLEMGDGRFSLSAWFVILCGSLGLRGIESI